MGKKILKTKLCDMLGIEYPILSAGMGPALIGEEVGAPVELVVAVSEAGGCGVLGAAGYTLNELRQHVREIKAQTDKPFGVDLLLPKNLFGAPAGEGPSILDGPEEESHQKVQFSVIMQALPKVYQDWVKKVMEEMELPDVELAIPKNSTVAMPKESVQICLEEKVPLFCAGLGSPGFMVEDAHAVGTKVLAITGNVKNAKRMAGEGIDLLVAQGHEGGGHTGRIGTMALLPQVIDAVSPLPVLAAGGIGDGRGLAAALAMGCVGVWVGTRFLATDEGGANDVIKKNIVEATDEDTRVSYLYTGKTSRAIYNRFHDLWDLSGLDPIPFPAQVLIASGLFAAFLKAKKHDYVGGFAGQVSGLIKEIKPARVVLDEMVAEAVDILTKKLPQNVTAK